MAEEPVLLTTAASEHLVSGTVSSTAVKAQGPWADSWGGEFMRGRQEASLGFSLGWCLRNPADIQTPRRQKEYMFVCSGQKF